MAFIKIGDNENILGLLEGDQTVKCDKCGKAIKTLKLIADQNEPICDCEEQDDE